MSGSTSFDDLKTVNTIKFDTFKQAALAHGLIEDDTHHNKCLYEAAEIKTGKQLRDLFSIILCYCTVAYPFQLWTKYNLCVDLLYKKKKKATTRSL